MKNKKFLWIINQYANIPEFPGHTRQYEISLGLAEKNWDVEIFASDFNLSERKFKRLKGIKFFLKEKINKVNWNWVKVIPYKRNNFLRYINMISFCTNLIIVLNLKFFKNILFNIPPPIIFGSSPQLPAAFLSLFFAKIYKLKFVLEVRDIWPQILIDTSENYPSFLVNILSFMEIYLYKNSDLIIVLTNGVKKYIENKKGVNVICLPNGPDLSTFKFKSLPPENKENFNNHRKFLILYSGAHGKVNGLMNVINASRLLKNYPIEIHLVGDGPEKINLIKACKGIKNIKFFDPIPKLKMPYMISKYDSVLLSLGNIALFKYGVSPNKLYDAYAVGRPIIATVPGDINDEIKKLNLGIGTVPDNPRKLANAIISIFNKPRNVREEMGKNARKCAENLYSRDLILQKLNVSLSKLINKDNG